MLNPAAGRGTASSAPLIEEGLAPSYDGRGLNSLLPTFLAHFGIPDLPGPTLDPAVFPPDLLRGVERIVFIVADGLGANELARHTGPGSALRLRDAMRDGHSAAITTGLPSTTATALCTLASGRTPQEHGILGYKMYAPILGAVVNTIYQRPVLGGPTLQELGVAPEAFFPFTTGHQRMSEAGIANHALTRDLFTGSAFSSSLYRGIRPEGYVDLPEALSRARRWLDRTRGRGFLRVYWETIDTVSHETYPGSESYAATLAGFDHALFHELVHRVRDPATLVVLTADHGHLTIPGERTISWKAHPDLLAHLAVPPTGEGRLCYLHARHGHKEAARDYLHANLGHAAWVVDAAEALAAGLFGHGTPHPELERRMGDLLLFARENYRFVYPYKPEGPPPAVMGHHGGTHPEEILVPLVAFRLG